MQRLLGSPLRTKGGKHPDDQLARFHLKRLLNGAAGKRIAMD